MKIKWKNKHEIILVGRKKKQCFEQLIDNFHCIANKSSKGPTIWIIPFFFTKPLSLGAWALFTG